MLCLESLVGVDPAGVQGLEPPADPGPERGECPATRPGRHLLHRPAWLVAPEPDQEVLNLTNFHSRSFMILNVKKSNWSRLRRINIQ